MVTPEPAHHVGEDRAPLLLPVQADAPGVVHVVALFGQRLDQPHVLQEPVARRIVGAAAALAAVVVAAILKENADRLPLALADLFGIDVAAAKIREASDDAQDFAELVRPLPGDGEGGNRAGARAADATVF